MLTCLDYKVDKVLLQEAKNSILRVDFKESINKPLGNFFYDDWEIKPEYQNTVWEKILKTLPFRFGEARIIILKGGQCYQSHADIDDRYHLNISGKYSFLIDLDSKKMHPQINDGYWYDMNAGVRHVAANFGNIDRVQLVVRKLLNNNKLKNPIKIKISYFGDNKDTARFLFDNIFSPWFNYANKNSKIANFQFDHNNVQIQIEEESLIEIKDLMVNDFKLEIL